jgi:hypothetical protein
MTDLPCLECSFCQKKYKSIRHYKKHITLCEFFSKTSRHDASNDNIPSQRVLYEIIVDMAGKYSKMEEQLEKLNKWAETKKRKLHIVEWLNENYLLETDFDEWCKGITINRSHLELVFKFDFVAGVMYIFQELLSLSNERNLPIKCFDQKENALFVRSKESEGWGEMSGKQFEYLIGSISKQLINQLAEWQTENANKMGQEDFGVTYATNVQKVLGGTLPRDQLYSKVRRGLYKHLKMNLRNIIQYEFSF